MKIKKEYEIDLGEFSTDHSVFVVYDEHKYMPSEENSNYVIREFTPNMVLNSLEYTIKFDPFIELFNEYTDTVEHQFINIYNKDPEYKIFQTKEEAEKYIKHLDERDNEVKKKDIIEELKQSLKDILSKHKVKNKQKDLVEKLIKSIEHEF